MRCFDRKFLYGAITIVLGFLFLGLNAFKGSVMKQKYFLLTIFLAVIACDSGVEVAVDVAEADYMMRSSLTIEDMPGDIFLESRARLPQVKRDDLDVIGQDAFDTYVTPGTGYEAGLSGPIGMLMYSPELAKAIFNVRQRVRYGSAKDQRLTELTIILTARELDNQYVYTSHEPAAKNAGLEQGIIDIVRFQQLLDESIQIDGLGETEKVIIQFVREVINEEQVSSATFAKATELLGNEGVVDLAGLVGYYSFMSTIIRTFNLQRPIGSDLLLPIRVEDERQN